MEARARVIIVSDGKRGHENQSRVTARMLGDQAPLLMLLRDSVKEGGGSELLLRLRFALFGKAGLSQLHAAGLVRAMLRPDQPDEFRAFAGAYAGRQGTAAAEAAERAPLFVVSTGTPPATMNLLLARLLGARSVVNMTPSLLPRARFDLNIVPEHDLSSRTVPAPNVVATPLALGYHDQPAAQFLAAQLRRDNDLGRHAGHIGLAVGGPSRSAPWDSELVHAALEALHAACLGAGKGLLITTSRRTPAATLDYLQGWLGRGAAGYLLDANTDSLNPLPAFYELAEAMVVTADSFSMASEALHAGHGPLLLPVNVGPPRGGLRRGLQLLLESNLAVEGRDALQIAQFVAAPPARGAANAIYDELARQVGKRLGL